MNTLEEKCSDIVTEETYQTLLKLASEVAQNFNIKLDYSHDSIKNVEKILKEFHEDYTKTKNEEGLNGISIEFGIYIVETIRRNSEEKGVLYTNHADFGEKTFPFYWKEQILFTCEWCKKRIFDGEGNNVYMKYKTLNLEPKKRFLGIF